jgi:menaquinone-specific isochorismate synthase
VGIRHICWRGDEVLLPSGCGFIAESDPAREWRELALKRESVKRMFGV